MDKDDDLVELDIPDDAFMTLMGEGEPDEIVLEGRMFDIKFHYSPGKWAQIATVLKPDQKNLYEFVIGLEEEDRPWIQGLFVDLDRPRINMIRQILDRIEAAGLEGDDPDGRESAGS